ncbi:multicopper oxidase family protein [Arthrobacter sp. MPF02]|uniref:multicopper oxidase family protein n=1 Tax=Arthrobacter sp. MPF02 TaxID=3388492 RepID=UPI003984AB74
MGASQLLGLDLVLSVLTAAAWCAAAWLLLDTGRRPASAGAVSARLVLPSLAAALVLTAAKAAAVGALAATGWWFAAERAAVGLPLLVLPAMVGGVAGLRAAPRPGRLESRPAPPAGGRFPAPVVVLWAAVGAVSSMLVPFILGYTPHPSSVAVFMALAGCAGLVCWLLFGPQHAARRTTAASAVGALMLATLLGSAGLAWLGSRSAEGMAIAAAGHQHGGAAGPAIRPVTDLTGELPPDAPVRHFELTARQERVTSPLGKTAEAWTFGSLPGPALEAELGDVLEVLLVNRDVASGVTLHWHGYDVPNAMDGVAGTTQDAVLPGKSMTYRFLARQSGTYWYHTHQMSSEGVRKGLYGTLVVRDPRQPQPATDLVVAGHSLGPLTLLGSSDGVQHHAAEAGTEARLRLVNTDSLPQRYQILGAPYTVAAVDGTDLDKPITVPASNASGTILRIGAGGRMDATFTMPAHPVTLRLEGSASAAVVLVPAGGGRPEAAAAGFRAGAELDLFGPASAPVQEPISASAWTRTAVMVLDRQPRFVNGVPRYAYTVNGSAYPHIEPLVVDPGDTIKVTVVNRTSEPHPMHPHGHHVRVLARNGEAPESNMLRMDTFDVLPGEVWEVLLTADNPGIWMDHCHNLAHAAEGMMMHLQYRGYSSPFVHGGASGNRAE